MDIKIIQGSLEIRENPGLEIIDPVFGDIATLVQEGNYEQAAVQSEKILKEKTYDIRIIGYFFYGLFLEKGLGGMADIFITLSEILKSNIDAIGPVRNREKQIKTILTWLMKQLLKKMQYEEKKKSDIWDSWLSVVSSDQVQEALDAADDLRKTLGQTLEDLSGTVLEGLMKINEWLTSFQHLVYMEPEPEVPQKVDEMDEPEEMDNAEDWQDEEEAFEEKTEKRPLPVFMEDKDCASVEGSWHLNILIKKLEAFNNLISVGKYLGAALVADDINSIIADFDPKIYFPKLFANFSLLFATNINQLSDYEEYKNTAEWNALKELYKVDLDSFVNFDLDAVDMSTSEGAGGTEEEDEEMPEQEEDLSEENGEGAEEDDNW